MRRHIPIPLLLLAVACSGEPSEQTESPSPSGEDPSPAPVADPGRIAYFKLEWGSLQNEALAWSGRVSLDAASLRDAAPYLPEDGDSYDFSALEFSTWSDSRLTDGLLLHLWIEPQATLSLSTPFGDIETVLYDFALDEARFLMLDDARYVEIASIRPDEWELGLAYNDRPTERSDALPEPAYMSLVEASRYNSETSQQSIYEDSLERYETDPFFQNAEDLRRAVNQQLYVVVPSVLEVGETFDVSVAAFDINGHLVADFAGPVELRVDGAQLELPSEVPFVVGQNSIVTVARAGIAIEAGYARIEAVDASGRFAPGAIPVRIEDAPAERIYWGDLHTHSNLSDGDFGDLGPEEVYRYGRDVGRIDFQALSDHDYRRPIPDWKWPRHIAAAEAYYEPGRFVTLLGYEWSGEDMRFSEVISHKNVYFREGTGPVYSAFDPRYNSPEKLWAALRASPGVGHAITIPHHPVRNIVVTESSPWYGGAGTDWRFHDADLQPLVEVYSRWGISERTSSDNPRPVKDGTDTNSAQYALGLGYQLGFVASGDTHDGTPGVSVLPYRQGINAYPTGLMAVFAPELTRGEVFDALYARRCYGTSGGRRMLLDLRTTTGLRAGEAGTVSGAPEFEVTVAGTTGLAVVDLVRVTSGGATVVWRGSSEHWLLETRVPDASFPSAGAYYLRVTQADNELGWIGPIFLEGT